jgi:hypothetical protein
LDPGKGVYWIDISQFPGIIDQIAMWPSALISFDDANESDVLIAFPALLDGGLTAHNKNNQKPTRALSPWSQLPSGVATLGEAQEGRRDEESAITFNLVHPLLSLLGARQISAQSIVITTANLVFRSTPASSAPTKDGASASMAADDI